MNLLSLALTWVVVSVVSSLILRRLVAREEPRRPAITVNVVLDADGVRALIALGRAEAEIAELERMVRD